jgi:hypothetical protein
MKKAAGGRRPEVRELSARVKRGSDADSSDNGNEKKDKEHGRTHFLPPIK